MDEHDITRAASGRRHGYQSIYMMDRHQLLGAPLSFLPYCSSSADLKAATGILDAQPPGRTAPTAPSKSSHPSTGAGAESGDATLSAALKDLRDGETKPESMKLIRQRTHTHLRSGEESASKRWQTRIPTLDISQDIAKARVAAELASRSEGGVVTATPPLPPKPCVKAKATGSSTPPVVPPATPAADEDTLFDFYDIMINQLCSFGLQAVDETASEGIRNHVGLANTVLYGQMLQTLSVCLFSKSVSRIVSVAPPLMNLAELNFTHTGGQGTNLLNSLEGRCLFVSALGMLTKDVSELHILSEGFEFLVFMVGVALGSIEKQKCLTRMDILLGRVLQIASAKIFRVWTIPDEGVSEKDYLTPYIMGFNMWTKIEYWSRAFFQEQSYLSVRRDDSGVQARLLVRYASLMIDWDFPLHDVHDFVRFCCLHGALPTDTAEKVFSSLISSSLNHAHSVLE